MVDVVIRAATEADVYDLAPRMRGADRDEVRASHDMGPEQALLTSLRGSTHAWAGLADGKLTVMFGVAPASLLYRVGVPWLLGSEDVEKYQIPFIRRCRGYVGEMLLCYSHLVNLVDSRNTVSQRWLKWMGFEMSQPEPYGFHRLPFIRFEKRA